MDPSTALIEVAFFLLFGVALWRYLKRRGPVELGVVAVFSTTGALLLLSFVAAFLPGFVAIVRPVATAALVAQPYFIVRLLGQVWSVPKWASRLALAGCIVVSAGLILLGGRSIAALLALVIYFGVIETAAAAEFVRLARRRRGAHRIRLTLAGFATGIFGLLIVLLGVGSAANSAAGGGSGVVVLSRILAVVAAAGYLAAFMPPSWVMGFFHRAAAFDLVRAVVLGKAGQGPDILWGQLTLAAEALLGASRIEIVDADGRPIEVDRAAAAALVPIGPAGVQLSVEANAEQERRTEIAIPLLSDGLVVATLLAHLDGRPLFVEDDIAIVSLLGSLTARSVQHAADLERLREIEQALQVSSALRASEARFRVILEADPNAILATDEDGRISWSTRSSEALFGYPPGALVGHRLADVLDIPPVSTSVAAEREQVPRIDTTAVRADGSVLPVEVAIREVEIDGLPTTVAIVSDSSWREEADQIRDRFIGILSHELRTPITSIYGGAQVLLKRAAALDDETRHDLLLGLTTESERLQRMIENLLILARVERGAEFFGPRPVLIQRVLASVIDHERTLAPEATIRLKAVEPLPVVTGDEDQLAQIMRNLLANALKYAGESAVIDVLIESAPPGVDVTVSDNGPGFPAEEGEQLFGLYYRSPRAKAAPGAGIGLFVCRQLVEAMGGTIQARSRPGGGAAFTFTLPAYDELEGDPEPVRAAAPSSAGM